jgi:hypothetical protein
MASQTLLSRRTRTGQGENFCFGQGAFAGQTVESRQGAIQFVFRRKKVLIDALDLLIGQPLDFFNDLRCVHISNLAAATEIAKLKIKLEMRERFDFKLDFLGGFYQHFPMSKPARAGDAAKSSLPFEDALKTGRCRFAKWFPCPLGLVVNQEADTNSGNSRDAAT